MMPVTVDEKSLALWKKKALEEAHKHVAARFMVNLIHAYERLLKRVSNEGKIS